MIEQHIFLICMAMTFTTGALAGFGIAWVCWDTKRESEQSNQVSSEER